MPPEKKMKRRSLLLGFGAALAAPAVVRAESLMKVASLRSGANATATANWLLHAYPDMYESPYGTVRLLPSRTMAEHMAMAVFQNAKLVKRLVPRVYSPAS
jgi:hypothetical protein